MSKFSCVVITGASSGIGLELARQLAPLTSRMVLVARTETRLQEICTELNQQNSLKVTYLLSDLEQPGAGEVLWGQICSQELHPDLWVNDAGFGLYGSISELVLEREQAMIQLNVTALMTLTTLASRDMLLMGKGTVLNVASVAGFQPGPRMAVYFASKAFVLSYSEALAEELAATGVRILVLCPGSTKTKFHAVAGTERVKAMYKFSSMSAQQVAHSAIHQILCGKRVNVPGVINRLMVLSIRFIPRRLVVWISGKVLRIG